MKNFQNIPRGNIIYWKPENTLMVFLKRRKGKGQNRHYTLRFCRFTRADRPIHVSTSPRGTAPEPGPHNQNIPSRFGLLPRGILLFVTLLSFLPTNALPRHHVEKLHCSAGMQNGRDIFLEREPEFSDSSRSSSWPQAQRRRAVLWVWRSGLEGGEVGFPSWNVFFVARMSRKPVLVLLCVTVLAPIVLYTDRLSSFSNSICKHV